jgi:hypothetical protein
MPVPLPVATKGAWTPAAAPLSRPSNHFQLEPWPGGPASTVEARPLWEPGMLPANALATEHEPAAPVPGLVRTRSNFTFDFKALFCRASAPAVRIVLSGLAVLVLLVPGRALLDANHRLRDALAGRWTSLRRNVADRAGVKLVERFDSGPDRWESRGESGATWKRDEKGFMVPGEMAIYKPSAEMANYTMEFLGQIDLKALSWVFRAKDRKNYYVAKLAFARPGPLQELSLRRYAVLDGKEMPACDTPIPSIIRGERTLQVRLNAHGSDFSVYIRDRIIDSWSDSRLRSGGIGFFSGKGERSRISWVNLRYQYDVLGRICAFFSQPPFASQSICEIGSCLK